MIWLTKELRSIIRSFLKYLILARNFSQSSILYVSQTVADNHSFRVRFWYLGFKFFSPFEIKLFFWIHYHKLWFTTMYQWIAIIDCCYQSLIATGMIAICNKGINATDFKSVSKEEALVQASVFLWRNLQDWSFHQFLGQS